MAMPLPSIQIRNRIIQPESESIKLRMRLAGWLAGWMLKFPSLWPAAANWNNERGFNYRRQTIVAASKSANRFSTASG